MDFYEAKVERKERPVRLEVYPDFFIDDNSEDLMIRGGKFYAVWDEQTGMWSRNIKLIQKRVDADLFEMRDKIKNTPSYDGTKIQVMNMRSSSTGSWRRFMRFIDDLPDDYHQLDTKLIFQDTKTKKTDYASRRLPYSVQKGDISAYDKIMSVLYAPEERAKFEWAIGSIIAGDSKSIQKFIVFHGPMGSGKSTVMNLIEKLFGGYRDGYCAKINAQALVSGNAQFALTPFAKSPLVGIDQDSKLSKIEDNTILNQVVSHDMLEINQKFKDLFESSAQCFLFMGTNEPVRITNSKSGIIRRLIDVEPTGDLISPESEYEALVSQMDFELGAIAEHCLSVYKKMGKSYYSRYIPRRMMLRTDPFFNFMLDNLEVFQRNGGATGNELWAMYKSWCDDSGMDFKLKRFQVWDEAKSYFESFEERAFIDGKQVRNWFSGIKTKKFVNELHDFRKETAEQDIPAWLEMKKQPSLLDTVLADCRAQYGDEKPALYWKDVKTTLKDLDTSKTHYVQVPPKLIHIDFDKKNAEGKKDFKLNAAAAAAYPETYAERSKGGEGIHLSYWYDGDPEDLSLVVEEGVEVKVQTGNAALRRRVSLCNNLPIAHISSGLPLKKKKVINDFALKDVRHLRNRIMMALRKEVEPKATRTSMNYIQDSLKEAQEKGIAYDFTDLDEIISAFAHNSTNSKDYCVKVYCDLKLRWPEDPVPEVVDVGKQILQTKWALEAPIVFFDVEVFKNLFLIVYKELGPEKKCVFLFNPKPHEIEPLFSMRLVGFNNRGYDNFLIWAAYRGYTNIQLYDLSQEIIVGGNRTPDRDAINASYTDIFDYCSKKQSLKKWEIELGKHHLELGWPWDQPVPEEMWPKVAEYCANDVIATEAVWEATQPDFVAREILANLAGGTVNDTTNQLTAKFIFGDVREPWKEFVYPDLKKKFPGYCFEGGKSYFGDELIGEGGRVYAQPGMYRNVKTFDVASMHPSSIIAENGFGPYTKRFKEIMDVRIAIKHKDYEKARTMLGGKLAPYLNDPTQAKQLSFALKIAINSVYGLTAAKFQNKFKDPRNVDNWVAKRGALFMETLRLKVQAMGATVVHIKTDSIKIADPTPEVEQFILDYGKQFGYNFEVESIYDRICLVNDAVYIAKCSDDPENGDEAGHWTATGAQFQHPYVFKTLFSKENLEFRDFCETKSVKTDMYLDMNEEKPDVSKFEKEFDKLSKELKKQYGNGWRDIVDNMDADKADDTIRYCWDLENEIAQGHDYHFVGKAGSFCPISPGKGGGILYRRNTSGGYDSVAGTKGYRWLEAEQVKDLHYEDNIDMGYFRELADVAKETISKFGSFDVFVSGDNFQNGQTARDVSDNPPWLTPCCSAEYEYCYDCPNYFGEQEYCCKLGYNVSNQIMSD